MKYHEKTDVEKVYFTVGEASAIVGVSESNIRFWLNRFDMEVDRYKCNYRKLSSKDLNKLFEIKRLLHEEGFTIWGAKKKLKEYKVEEPC
jgi:DNA-binding transcriptional MerR regulator